MFFFLQNSSLLFSITRCSSSSVIHVSVNNKNHVEKDTTLLLFFLSRQCDFFPNKTFSCISVAIPVNWIILHWYACGADGLSGDRSVGRCTVTWLPNFLWWVVDHIFLTIVLRCARFAREKTTGVNFYSIYVFECCQKNFCCNIICSALVIDLQVGQNNLFRIVKKKYMISGCGWMSWAGRIPWQ